MSGGMSEQSKRIPGGSSFIIRLLLSMVQFCFQMSTFTIGGTWAESNTNGRGKDGGEEFVSNYSNRII